MIYDEKKLTPMSTSELMETNGGVGPIAVTLIVLGCCGILGLGIYNGYQDTKDQKK